MPYNLTEEFVHSLIEQNAALTEQISDLTATVRELNQTMKELEEKLNKIRELNRVEENHPEQTGAKRFKELHTSMESVLLRQSETHWTGTRISYLGEGVLNSYKIKNFKTTEEKIWSIIEEEKRVFKVTPQSYSVLEDIHTRHWQEENHENI